MIKSPVTKPVLSLLILSILFILIPPRIFQGTTTNFYWNILEVGIPDAWQYTSGSSDIVVAIIDSGIDFTHPDLVNSSWKNPGEIPNNKKDDDQNGYVDDIVGWDFRKNDKDPSPPSPPYPASKHGTFIAGLIAADDDNDLFVGVAPEVKIMSLRFLDNDLSFSSADWPKLANAIDYAVKNGARIINLSLQANGIPPNDVYEAIRRAYAAGVIIVGVTGNNEDHVTYPGSYSEVIAVSSTTSSRQLADSSAYGNQTEICSPGDEVYSITGYNSSIVLGSGTSFAAPLVSGAIALMLSMNYSLTNNEIRNLLSISCVDLGEEGKDPLFGFGLLNISAALSHIIPTNHSSTTSSITQLPRIQSDIIVLVFSYGLLLGVMVIFFFRKTNDFSK